jgi:hypothetical protein
VSTYTGKHRAVVDAFAHLIADITASPGDAAAQRLRSVTLAALRTQLREPLSIDALAAVTAWRPPIADAERDALIGELDALAASGETPEEAALINRRDDREALLSGRLVDRLSGLQPAERLGPFDTLGGIDVWFDLYMPARRMTVREAGASAALVLTQARPPVFRHGATRIDVEPGTVWVRGNLLGAFPAGAFIGIKVTGGMLTLDHRATITDNQVEVPAPFSGSLRLDLAADVAAPVDGACAVAGASVTLPLSITFTLNGGAWTVDAGPGKAEAYGQSFNFGPCRGAWTFVERLWTAVLEYDFNPAQFDADPIGDDLAHFEGVAEILRGGLGLPVVVVNPALLGEAATGAGWFLQLKSILARWYDPDLRFSELLEAWAGITASGFTLVADGIAPLAPPVAHTYELWQIAGGEKRLPWRQTYADPFMIFYRCDVAQGEHFLATGRADVALDRPLRTDGTPVPTQTSQGAVLLHQFDGEITASLVAQVKSEPVVHQFALRNALVWTAAPLFLFARGALLPARRIDAGTLQVALGMFGWAPTLPDPYVANVFIQQPERGQTARGLLIVRVTWAAPDEAVVSFEGQLGPQLALGKRDTSPGEPRPARKSDNDPAVGLTQVEQGRLGLSKREQGEQRAAQAEEQDRRGQRVEEANQKNRAALLTIDRYLTEIVGPAPSLVLLDVSTNQDLLGVGVSARGGQDFTVSQIPNAFPVSDLAVHSPVGQMRVVALPQAQWEPVRTLDEDQDVMTMGWFPTPLASATDGGATQIGARSQKLMPIIPDDALQGTFDAYRDGTPVGMRTTFPFGLIAAVQLQPKDAGPRLADKYELTRPSFPDESSRGGIQVTARAEGGRSDNGGISPTFEGRMLQLLNGVDLASGAVLGLSVLGETLQPAGSVETVFNNDMTANPRVPVTRVDISGYGGSNFSDWNNPFAVFAEAAKVQFQLMVGRTALEIIKVNSVLHPWCIRVTRSITIERRPGGGVIRRDSGWQASSPGIFDCRYFDTNINAIAVAPYKFDAGVFRGLFNVRTIRPAPGAVFSNSGATLVPYYFDADVAFEGMPERTPGVGILGWLQTAPSGAPASPNALRALIEAQGPIGGPVDAWMDFGGSGLPFRAQRIEVGLAIDGADPLFVATARGAPSLPTTGAWSVAMRPVASVPPNGGEATPVAENRGVPLIRRYPIAYPANDTVFTEPQLGGPTGDYRFADAADLLTPANPKNEYALLQSTPTHSFLYPRPFVPSGGAPRIQTTRSPALADIYARSTSKGAFPPPANAIELAPGALHLDVSPGGRLALSAPINVVGHPTPLRIGGTPGHGSQLLYNLATMRMNIEPDRWEAEFTGLRIWSDIAGLEAITGSELRIVGATEQRSQIAEIKSLMLQEIEEILQYIPIFGQRGTQGPVDLGATNAKHEIKVEVSVKFSVPPPQVVATFPAGTGLVFTFLVKSSTGIDLATGGPKASAAFVGQLEGKIPLLSVAVATAFLIITGEVEFSLTSVSGSVTAEKLGLLAFVGIGVEGKIGPFKAYAFLGIGFVLEYNAIANTTKYGGLVALEAGVDLVIVKVKIRAELKGLVYNDAGATKCDYSGSVKVNVDIFLIISISATYKVTETTTFS